VKFKNRSVNESRRSRGRETMTVGCRRLMKNSCVVQTKITARSKLAYILRGEIYFRLRHSSARSLLLCPGTARKLVYRYTASRNVAGINLWWPGCACLQHFSSADLCGGCPEFQFARCGPQILMRELHNGAACAKTATIGDAYNGKCAKSGANFVAKWL
jgi:hypothetical protein